MEGRFRLCTADVRCERRQTILLRSTFDCRERQLPCDSGSHTRARYMPIIAIIDRAPADHIGRGAQWRAPPTLGPAVSGGAAHRWEQCAEKNHCPAHIPLDFTAKASIAVVLTASFLSRHPPGPERRACGGASIATGVVPMWRTRPWQPSKPASKQRARQKQRPVSRTTRPATAGAGRNRVVYGHSHSRLGRGLIEQTQ
jgi:hypothetical protein